MPKKLLDFDFVDLHKDAMESTPPPVPATPSPATTPQPPRGWWSRNWKWLVPTGCLTFVAIGAVFVVCIVFFVFGVIKSSDGYQTALKRAKQDDRVTAALGSPIKDGLVPSGKTSVNGASGDANLEIPISGPKGKATIYAVGTKSEGKWEFSKLTVQVENGETIDLKGGSGQMPRPPARSTRSQQTDSEEENSNEDTSKEESTDERIESIKLARADGDRLRAVEDFKPTDNPQHIVIKLTEGSEGTHIKTVWTNVNAGGATNQKLWTKELVPTDEDRSADFSLSNSGNKAFPTGDYKIDVYLDDELVQTVRYKVK